MKREFIYKLLSALLVLIIAIIGTTIVWKNTQGTRALNKAMREHIRSVDPFIDGYSDAVGELMDINDVVVVSGDTTKPEKVEKEDEAMGDQPEVKASEDEENDIDVEAEESDDQHQWDIRELSIKKEWNGLKIEILSMGLGEVPDFTEEVIGVVALKFRIENTRTDGEGDSITYLDQGTLITSTGEQLDADIFHFEQTSGLTWFLERTNVFEIEWVRVRFSARNDNLNQDYEIRINID